jgi:hypothetical protein
MGNPGVQTVNRAANHQRKENPDAVVEQNGEKANDKSAPVSLQVWKQRAQIVEHAVRGPLN